MSAPGETAPLLDLSGGEAPKRRILPVRKLAAVATGLFQAAGDHFETQAVEQLPLTFEGIEADLHAGWTRKSGSREPWYKRGTEMRNERQITIVASDELALVAKAMNLAVLRPEWIGANLLLDGVPELSMLPPATLIFFQGGVTLKVDAQNAPCRDAGRQVALRAGIEDRLAGELLFPQVAKRHRGLTAWVEKPGVIAKGEIASVRVPEQWLY